MASSSRRKQDEKHLKILRELVSQPANKTCFDCNQKGPTYINMLVGSFVCTTCSGILRGLNPPHRVKSISMASFTPEEIEQIKQKGNHYCRAVWLGLYDLKANPFPDTKDEHKIRDFMIAKYEKRRFYVDPSIALKSMPPQTTVSTPTSSTPTTDNKPAASVARPIVTSSQSTGSVNGGSSHGSSKTATPKSSSLDLLADMSRNNDPFASPTLPAPPASQPSFANFENATIFTNTPTKFFTESLSANAVQKISFPSPDKVLVSSTASPTLTVQSPTTSGTQTPSPICYGWEAYDSDDLPVNAGTPLIPIAGFPSLKSSSAAASCDNKPSVLFAAGVSAQFIACETNTSAACSPCSKAIPGTKKTYNESRTHDLDQKEDKQSESPFVEPEVSLELYSRSAPISIPMARSKKHLHSEIKKSPFPSFSPSTRFSDHSNRNSYKSDRVSYSILSFDSSRSGSASPLDKGTPNVSRNLGGIANELGPKCSTVKRENRSESSYLNTSSNIYTEVEVSKDKSGISSLLDKPKGHVDMKCLGKTREDFDTFGTAPPHENLIDPRFEGDLVGDIDVFGNDFLLEDVDVENKECSEDDNVFDNAPFISSKKPSKREVPKVLSKEVKCNSGFGDGVTNPFLAASSTAAFDNLSLTPTQASHTNSSKGSLHTVQNNNQVTNTFSIMHDKGNSQSMTSNVCCLAGSTTATKPSGLPPFPSATLTPLTPSTSGSGPATVPQAAPHSTTTTTTLEAAAASSTTTTQQEDRYAALKDLDDLLKSQKEETNGSGKGNWSIANGSTQGSAFNGTTNGVFGSPSNSSSVFGSHMVNGGNSPMGVFGTPPSNGGTNFLPQTSQAWSSNFTANPFTAAQSGVNGTGNGGSGSTSPWMNGGANTTVTNSNSLFSPATQTQPGFGNISAQPNPFGADPNFNQFGSNGQVTNSSSNGTGWANFNTQPTQTKMQWASNASVNPFAAPSQMPSGSTSYNPFL